MDRPKCPRCGGYLEADATKEEGQRVSCPDCGYPQSDSQVRKGVTTVSRLGSTPLAQQGTGVKIINNRRG